MDTVQNTIKEWKKHFTKAKTFFGMDRLEYLNFLYFAHGTQEVAQLLASLMQQRCRRRRFCIGHQWNGPFGKVFSSFNWRRASLEFIEYGHLPGVDALSEK